MANFLADNPFGQTILRLVSRGNVTIAALLKLKDQVPKVFRLATSTDVAKCGDILLDLSYFSNPEKYETKIEKNPILLELDEQLRNAYGGIVSKFYDAFESIYKYITDLNRYIEELEQGFFTHMTLESVLQNVEGKQLLAEALYLYGVMLLIADWYFEGTIRERILTFHYRSSALQSSDTNIDDVCKLLRSTGLTPTFRPVRYPEDYFSRVHVDETYVNMLIGRLRSDDIYNQMCRYPLPAHRSTALAPQASLLFVALYFAPNILKSQRAIMREITDKFFVDNWIISVYVGFHINIFEAWDTFPAAKEALQNTIDVDTVKSMVASLERIPKLAESIKKVLKDGALTETNILEKSAVVLNQLRDSNVVLRWTLQHASNIPNSGSDSARKLKSLRELSNYLAKASRGYYIPILDLLISTAKLELQVKELFRKLLDEKRQKWDQCKEEAKSSTLELAEAFTAKLALSKIEKNDKLAGWLEAKAVQIETLDFDEVLVSGRKIMSLMRAYREMLEFHSLESKVQVRELVNDIISSLEQMLRTGNISEDVLVTLQIVGDFSYAWGPLIEVYTGEMQNLIQKQPSSVSDLRAVFLKLSSAMDMPLLRLNQAKSPDLISVSAYYSGELVSFVQKILQVIPEKIFSLLHLIIETTSVREVPTRLDKDKIREYAQLEERHQIAKLTNDMSILTEGISKMQTTLVGIIRIEPKTLLENGIRKELVSQITKLLNTTLNFSGKPIASRSERLLKKLNTVAHQKAAIQRSFEYIGDYVHAYGLHIFQEEYNRVISHAAHIDLSTVSRSDVVTHVKDGVPLPPLTVEDSSGYTFLGRLAKEIMTITDPKQTIFFNKFSTWQDNKGAVVLDQDTFTLIYDAIDLPGLTSLDKFYSHSLNGLLQQTSALIAAELMDRTMRPQMDTVVAETRHVPKLIANPRKTYTSWFSKICRQPQIADNIWKIGHLQLLRICLQNQLQITASADAKSLTCTLSALNSQITRELKKLSPMNVHELEVENIINYTDSLGIYEPLSKTYLINEPQQFVSPYLFLLTVQQLQKLTYSKTQGTLISRKPSETLDGLPFIVGMCTLLKQYHVSQSIAYTGRLCQYLNSLVNSFSSTSKEDVHDLGAIFKFISTFTSLNPESDNVGDWVNECVPCWNSVSTIVSML